MALHAMHLDATYAIWGPYTCGKVISYWPIEAVCMILPSPLVAFYHATPLRRQGG